LRDTGGKLVYDTAVRVDDLELKNMVGTLTPAGLQRLVALCSSKEEGGSAARYKVRSRWLLIHRALANPTAPAQAFVNAHGSTKDFIKDDSLANGSTGGYDSDAEPLSRSRTRSKPDAKLQKLLKESLEAQETLESEKKQLQADLTKAKKRPAELSVEKIADQVAKKLKAEVKSAVSLPTLASSVATAVGKRIDLVVPSISRQELEASLLSSETKIVQGLLKRGATEAGLEGEGGRYKVAWEAEKEFRRELSEQLNANLDKHTGDLQDNFKLFAQVMSAKSVGVSPVDSALTKLGFESKRDIWLFKTQAELQLHLDQFSGGEGEADMEGTLSKREMSAVVMYFKKKR
jgi:hypothetical protein